MDNVVVGDGCVIRRQWFGNAYGIGIIIMGDSFACYVWHAVCIFRGNALSPTPYSLPLRC